MNAFTPHQDVASSAVATLRQDVAALNYEFLSTARSAVRLDPVNAALQFGLTRDQVSALAQATSATLKALANGMGCMAFKPAFRAADLVQRDVGELQLS